MKIFRNIVLCITFLLLVSNLALADRQIVFSDITWQVKSSVSPVGPGPNYFSDSVDNVWLDENDWLHLKITHRDGKWYSAEVFTEQSLGYGKYTFYVVGKLDQLNENAILGLFNYEDHSREIDIEFSRWGEPLNDNSQYVIQPYTVDGNTYKFNTITEGTHTTHWFDWNPNRIFFQSIHGHSLSLATPNHLIDSWTYTGNHIPTQGNEKTHINLWLLRGTPPSDGKEIEIIIKEFEFIPFPDIKANGSDGPITINSNEPLAITVGLNPKGQLNQADWWVIAGTPWHKWYYYEPPSWGETDLNKLSVSYQGPLVSIEPPIEVLNEFGVLAEGT